MGLGLGSGPVLRGAVALRAGQLGQIGRDPGSHRVQSRDVEKILPGTQLPEALGEPRAGGVRLTPPQLELGSAAVDRGDELDEVEILAELHGEREVLGRRVEVAAGGREATGHTGPEQSGRAVELAPGELGQALLEFIPPAEAQEIIGGVGGHEVGKRERAETDGGRLAFEHDLERLADPALKPKDLAEVEVDLHQLLRASGPLGQGEGLTQVALAGLGIAEEGNGRAEQSSGRALGGECLLAAGERDRLGRLHPGLFPAAEE